MTSSYCKRTKAPPTEKIPAITTDIICPAWEIKETRIVIKTKTPNVQIENDHFLVNDYLESLII